MTDLTIIISWHSYYVLRIQVWIHTYLSRDILFCVCIISEYAPLYTHVSNGVWCKSISMFMTGHGVQGVILPWQSFSVVMMKHKNYWS